MSNLSTQLSTILPLLASTAILIAGVVDDVRSRKFHNWLFLTCCGAALAIVLLTGGISGVFLSIMGFGAGIAVLLPFVLLGMIGAGDMKLLAAFGIIAGWDAVVSVAVLSFVWGAIFGVVRIIANGQGKVLASNLTAIVTLRKREEIVVHRMPFTIALLMGWLSHLAHQGLL